MGCMRLAGRVLRVGESQTINVARRARELRESGASLVDLGAGEPGFSSPRVAATAAAAAIEAGFTRYTAVEGPLDLRLALARDVSDRFGAPWTGRGDVLVSVGAKAALMEAVMALVEPGAEVVIPSPCWSSLPAQVELVGGSPVLVPLDPGNDFRLDAEPLVAAFTDSTRALIVNSPCNPTGAVISQRTLRLLAEECARRDVVLISDETYERYVYAPRHHASVASIAREYGEHLVLVGSFSKSYAMTGWRVGYALGPERLIRAMTAVQSHLTTNATSFAMAGALAALEQGEDQIQSNVMHCLHNRQQLVDSLAEVSGVRCPEPEGAFYAFLDVRALIGERFDNTDDLARALLDQAGVVVVPGTAFGVEGHLRVSYAGSFGDIEEGSRRLRRFFHDLADEPVIVESASAPSKDSGQARSGDSEQASNEADRQI